jgi:catechol 2,3-dioxygenase
LARRLLSQLAHVELISPRPEQSLDFFTKALGLSVNAQEGQSAYLRAWGEHFHHSLVITEGPETELRHIGWRTAGSEELDIAVERLQAAGAGEGWQDAGPGHGPAFRYRSPGGHLQEIFWEVERYQAPPELASHMPIRPQKFAPVGAAVRQIDHVTIGTPQILADIDFYRESFGSRFMECAVLTADAEEPVFVEMSNNEQAHDLGLLPDPGYAGRAHHFAYWLDQAHEVNRAGEILMEQGIAVEFGPGKHGHGENTYMYVRDPGTEHRIEIFSGGYRNYEPDWEPRRWTVDQGGSEIFRNVVMPESMLTDLFPAADSAVAAESITASQFTGNA